jgi:hypothetical protein
MIGHDFCWNVPFHVPDRAHHDPIFLLTRA